MHTKGVLWRHKVAASTRRQIIFLPYLLPLRCCAKITHTSKRPATQWHRDGATASSTTKTTAQSGKHNYRSVAWGFRTLAGHEKYFALLQADFSDFSTSNPEQGPTFRPRGLVTPQLCGSFLFLAVTRTSSKPFPSLVGC